MARRKPVNGFKPGHPAYPIKKRWSLIEARKQKAAIESLLIRGASIGQIVRAMRVFKDEIQDLGCGGARTKRLIESIKETWKEEDDAKRAMNKAAAERRLMHHIENAKGKIGEDGTYFHANFSAIASFEKVLADIQDTRAPVKIQLDVQVSAKVAHLIATMTSDQVQLAMTEMNQLRQEAELWRQHATKTG